VKLGYSIPLPGPFRLFGTVWRSKSCRRRRRAPVYHGTLPGWSPHNHTREDLALACARRGAAQGGQVIIRLMYGRRDVVAGEPTTRP
jgi:hypothetical protein